ncbi:MAG: hypothetical protein LUF89_00375 [Ruminococcus sp.]|nr:hypothetical protein [Ruminococcus sp.]
MVQFGIFSIYEVLSQLLELWGLNMETQSTAKKTSLPQGHFFAVAQGATDRVMNTPLFLLRCKQLSLSMTELDLLTIGVVNDMFTEKENNTFGYPYRASQSDFDVF